MVILLFSWTSYPDVLWTRIYQLNPMSSLSAFPQPIEITGLVY